MDESKHIKSKKKSFRIDKNEKIVNEDFQTANIKQKMKKIKKRSSVPNYKNIETFDILENTQDEEETLQEEEPKPITPTTILDTIFEFFYSLMKNEKEGFVKFKRDDYEGYDSVKEGERSKFDLRALIIQLIETTYDSINYLNTSFATLLCKVFTEGRHKFNDVIIVREQIVLLLSTFVSMFAVLNWYFILFYAKDQDIIIRKFTRKMFLEMTVAESDEDGDIVPSLLSFLYWVFEFSVYFYEIFNDFVIVFLPKLASFFFDGRTKFVLLFISLIYMFKNMAIAFKNFLLGLVSNVTNNSLINFMYALLFIQFIISSVSLTLIGKSNVDIQTIQGFISSLANPVGSIIKLIIRFMIIMVVSVPAGGFAICGLILFYSFFGIVSYMGVENFSSTVEAILDNVRYSDSNYEKQRYCNNNWFYRLLLLIIQVIKFICHALYLLKYQVAVFVVFIIAAMTYNDKLSSVESIVSGMGFNVFMTILAGVFIFLLSVTIVANIFLNKDFLELLGIISRVIPSIFTKKEEVEEEKEVPLPQAYKKYTSNANSMFESFREMLKNEPIDIKDDENKEN